MKVFIEQEYYGVIKVDNREADVVQLWNNNDLVQIERDKLPELITALQSCLAPESKKLVHEIGEGC